MNKTDNQVVYKYRRYSTIDSKICNLVCIKSPTSFHNCCGIVSLTSGGGWFGPFAPGDGGDAIWLEHERIPGLAAGFDDGLVGGQLGQVWAHLVFAGERAAAPLARHHIALELVG
jgi:hypothetical protein